MKKCKFYSEEVGKCLFDGPLTDCPYQDDYSKCNCFEPRKEKTNYAIGTGECFNTGLTHTNCERLILIGYEIGDSAEISPEQLSEFDWININGIKFKKV